MYTVYTQDTFHSRQWKIMENHTFGEDGTCFCMEFFYKNRQVRFPESGRLVESSVSNFWAQHGYWCPARPRTFATNLPKQQHSLADLDLSSFWERCGVEFASPPDASSTQVRELPFFNGYVNMGQIYRWRISKKIGFSRWVRPIHWRCRNIY